MISANIYLVWKRYYFEETKNETWVCINHVLIFGPQKQFSKVGGIACLDEICDFFKERKKNQISSLSYPLLFSNFIIKILHFLIYGQRLCALSTNFSICDQHIIFRN